MACKLKKIGLISLVIRETKITGRYYYYCGEVSYIPNENVNGIIAWKQFQFLKNLNIRLLCDLAFPLPVICPR